MGKTRVSVENLRFDPSTNLKTINGQSIYGSGNISINIPPTDISGKQDTLVSGTSIKTINGQSILGSGDISVNIPVQMLYIQSDEPIINVGTKALWIQTLPDGSFDLKIVDNS